MPAMMTATEVDIMNGNLGPAYNKANEILEVLHKSGDRWSQSWTLLDLAYVLYFQGDYERAAMRTLEALSLSNTFGNLGAITIALAQAGALAARKAQQGSEPALITAAQLCGSTAILEQKPGIFTWLNSRKLYDDAIKEAKSFMSAETWNKGYSDGQSIAVDKAIQLAHQALNVDVEAEIQ
jgi:tetratricopeptide (TPR) repeat protein